MEIHPSAEVGAMLLAARELLKERWRKALVATQKANKFIKVGALPIEPTEEDVLLRALDVGVRAMLHSLTRSAPVDPSPAFVPPTVRDCHLFYRTGESPEELVEEDASGLKVEAGPHGKN